MAKFLSLISLLLLSSYNVCFGNTLLILGDSLSAGYQLSVEQAWPSLLPGELKSLNKSTTVINASISGDTTGNALARLPNLLKQHQPDTVLVELGANDGLRGFPLDIPKTNLIKIIDLIKTANAHPLLMQIQLPPNYGRRYTQGFEQMYIAISTQKAVPLIPFYLAPIIEKDDWMQPDGLHPNALAQPWIARFIAKNISSYL